MTPRLSSSAVSLETELTKVEEKLVHLPSSTKEIIKSLVQTESILSMLPQSASLSIIKPPRPIIKALIAEDLVRHSNIVLKISVACCICEIMRIMAPDTPYEDNQMKEFFELVVTLFEKVSSSDECYTKMMKVLKALSSGKFVVMMCHLQLDELIVRLFKRFLTAADSNSSAVVSKMDKIMTMILKESKELPRELVNLLAMNGKSKDEIASPVRVQLAKKVLKNYADQLNPDMTVNPESEKKTLAIVEKPSKSVTTVNGKRKRQVKSVAPGENLVGSRIKVWWPKDNTYYEGTVKSFDSSKQKHKVWYDDGDKESLDLKNEKWELVEGVSTMLDSAQSAKHGENLVGSRIKVWWPKDNTYYEGTVKSFDSFKQKHKVWYDDGDKESLDLKNETWELVEDVSPMLDPVQSAKHGENLVGSRIKVWWPADKSYCKGIVESFDQSIMKHKVMYDDGDEDVLNLNHRQWMLLEDVPYVPPEKVSSPLASPKKGVCAQALPIKDPSAQGPPRKSTQGPPRMSTQGQRKMVRSTQVPTKHVPAPQALTMKVATTQSGLKSVHGYKVKESIAPILEAIIKKHGDIASDCVFKTPTVRASILEVICEVFSRIQTNDVADTEMEEIQCHVSAAKANKMNVSWLLQHLDAIQKKMQTKDKCSLLTKGKASISLLNRAANKDFEETRTELLTAQEKFKEAEKFTQLVEKKLHDSFLKESKAALDNTTSFIS